MMLTRRVPAVVSAALVAVAGVGLGSSGAASSTARGANGDLAFTSLDGGIYLVGAAGGATEDISTPASFDTNPAWSPDGTKLAYASTRFGSGDIFVMDGNGQSDTRLTNDASADFLPAWSPDGARIAFVRSTPGQSRIYVMGADGSNAHAVSPVGGFAPDWSPDGALIAFSAFGSTRGPRIAVMRPDGSELRYLTDGTAVDSYPNWSPDGRVLAFQSDRGGSYEIWTVNRDGSGAKPLTSGSQFRCSGTGCSLPRFRPAWSPDGRQIAFAHDRDGRAQIYVMNADGSGQRRVTSHLMDAQDVSWQPAVDLVASARAARRATVGRKTTARVTVRNASPLQATAVAVELEVRGPASIASTRGAACSRGRPRVCRISSLPAGSSVTITVGIRVRRAGRVVLAATAASAEPEATPANNRGHRMISAKRG